MERTHQFVISVPQVISVVKQHQCQLYVLQARTVYLEPLCVNRARLAFFARRVLNYHRFVLLVNTVFQVKVSVPSALQAHTVQKNLHILCNVRGVLSAGQVLEVARSAQLVTTVRKNHQARSFATPVLTAALAKNSALNAHQAIFAVKVQQNRLGA